MAVTRQIKLFLIIGVSMVFLDLAAYRTLMWTGVGIDFAKGLAYCTGTVCAYFLNRRFTFRAKGSAKSFIAYVLLYLTSLLLNVGVNGAILRLLESEGEVALAIAYVCATGLTATANFLGLKFIVFRERRLS